MASRTMSGTGRVTIFPLVHFWPDVVGAVAYTTTGRFGIDAVVGYLAVPEVPDVHLMDVAARHSPNATEWVLCTGWSSRVVLKPTSVDLRDAEWELEVDGSSQPAKMIYGHEGLYVGRLTLKDPEKSDSPAAGQDYTLALARQVLGNRSGALVGS
ncbi:hypothetical protein [Streptomyces yunnanensis]|uniref:Uncharacterized protein n=1 Tax=Streptomyces yunnanensis TaxID=156453 RepID=A0A9X8MT68_9ACTN|nr:hypothetical protein [Streptomyces yunnanensis]SHL74328.1 hypothetical protein SAMN05216268_10646 [Streptomyces yunnanensis]